MDKLVSKETLLRQVDGLRDIARRARRLAEIVDEPEQTRLIQCADDFEESARRIEGEAATAKTSVMPQSTSLSPKS
jgi:hypothetical protein